MFIDPPEMLSVRKHLLPDGQRTVSGTTTVGSIPVPAGWY
ncbi:hypothetical protein D187_007231 [Cystobacter fuscus DSM 2262]|uniref:Uncharacterized protein n=1 Tax=Cystobacter fuscus (strain ATCC 25194 / DSM 2262 / NBRC 100088 / M29) TaxID=1242864 RepID=S9P3F0_CYSF2|nr:hypothetical protein D187_007231 [Cystobacter fuscus DSM 2262]